MLKRRPKSHVPMWVRNLPKGWFRDYLIFVFRKRSESERLFNQT